jgi:superfamily I DNA/RNA helicase
MEFFATTQATSAWLLSHPDIEGALVSVLHNLHGQLALRQAVFVAGPLRMAATVDGRVVALWHIDYLGSTGSEPWGLIRLDGRYRVAATGGMEAMLRASLRVFDSRLQNLLLPSNQNVRNHGEGMFTSVLGAGLTKQHSSLGYLEAQVGGSRAVFVVGPQEETDNLDKSMSLLTESLRQVAPIASSVVPALDSLTFAARSRPAVEIPLLKGLRVVESSPKVAIVETPKLTQVFSEPLRPLTYDKWVETGSPLGSEKRSLLESDLVEEQPLRIVGPAGSGKSLLMQLMAVRALKRKVDSGQLANGQVGRALYLVHNTAMMQNTIDRFETIWPHESRPKEAELDVLTLHAYCSDRLHIDPSNLLDPDAGQTKEYQLAAIASQLRGHLHGIDPEACQLFARAQQDDELIAVISRMIMHEIGIVIKGRALEHDRRQYVGQERPFSRFHSLLSEGERSIVFDVFTEYHREVFEEGGNLDSDDLALSLLSHLRTPLWQLKRKSQGYDYLFVDETQLYNENERRLFSYLTKQSGGNLPIAVAIDEAQSIENASSAGFASLGLTSMRNETLHSVFRSTRAILRLAFHIIQRTTDLFGPDFPNYTELSKSVTPDNHKLARTPSLLRTPPGKKLPEAVADLVRELRKSNVRQIGVVTMNERHIPALLSAVNDTGAQVIQIQHRGQRLDTRKPVVAVSPTHLVGGQEFDAVVVVGVESSVFPPRVSQDSLAVALEQEGLRRLYLAFTRARYQVHVVIDANANVSHLLRSALDVGLIQDGGAG